jgi:hypothetical protein
MRHYIACATFLHTVVAALSASSNPPWPVDQEVVRTLRLAVGGVLATFTEADAEAGAEGAGQAGGGAGGAVMAGTLTKAYLEEFLSNLHRPASASAWHPCEFDTVDANDMVNRSAADFTRVSNVCRVQWRCCL